MTHVIVPHVTCTNVFEAQRHDSITSNVNHAELQSHLMSVLFLSYLPPDAAPAPAYFFDWFGCTTVIWSLIGGLVGVLWPQV